MICHRPLTASEWFVRMEDGHLDAGLETIAKLDDERVALKEKLRTGKIVKIEKAE
jgi:hypothetical protein